MTVLASPSVAPGRDTIGRYELLLELGRGGMAVLYLARARGVGGFTRLFAIKRILPHLAADPLFVEMFLEEGRIAARLSHPNLCPVFELGQDGGELFLVMEYLDGVPWEALAAAALGDPADRRADLRADLRLGLRLGLAAGVLAQACEGLHHAHTFRDVDGTAMPIIHRDVSPQNLFVSVDGVCRVLDFGVSKVATDHRRTRTGVRKGKLPYMAPEQIRGEPLDGRADVWAIGVMLWEALTGVRLFDRDTDFLIYQAITDMPIPSVNPAIIGSARYPEAVDRILARALARDRDQRYATARELGLDLLQLTAEIGAPASRDAIAQAVAGLCGDQLASRKQAISTVIAQRAAAEAAVAATRNAVTEPGVAHAAAPRAGEADAAETVSMAMRRDAIVVEDRRRKRWITPLVSFAVLAGVVAVILAWRSDRAPGSAAEPRERSAGAANTASPSMPRVAPPAPIATADSHTSSPVTVPPTGNRASKLADADHGTSPASSGSLPPPASSPPVPSPQPVRPARRSAHGSPATASSRYAAASPGAPGTTLHGDDAAGAAPHGEDVRGAGSAAPSPTGMTGTTGQATGWYAVDSTPYATIFVDGRKIGDTPLDRISLPAGSHRVRAVLADGRQRTFAINIAPDQKTTSEMLTW